MAGHDLLIDLREILYGDPDRRMWDRLCAVFERLPDDDPGLDVALDYAEGLLTTWPDGLRRAPSKWTAELTDFDGQLRPSEAPDPRRAWTLVRAMSLETVNIQNDALDALASSPYLTPLTILELQAMPTTRRWGLTSSHIESMVEWPRFGQLKVLTLSFNAIDADGARAIAECSASAGLLSLDLSRNSIDNAGAEALAASKHLGGLRSLNLHGNPIDQAGFKALALSKTLHESVRDTFENLLQR